jgi:Holliday junction resolvasome RuvABC endonuclease subunit
VLLALDAGVRQTGWAVFESKRLLRTGVIASPKRNGLKGRDRIASLMVELELLAEDSQPQAVACCQPSGINWSVPSIRLLEESLLYWSETRKIGFYSYTTQEIRAAIAGFANALPDRLGYAIMVRLGLIGGGPPTDGKPSRWATTTCLAHPAGGNSSPGYSLLRLPRLRRSLAPE